MKIFSLLMCAMPMATLGFMPPVAKRIVASSTLLRLPLRTTAPKIQPKSLVVVKASDAAEGKKNIPGLEGWDPSQFIAPAFHNKPIVRLLAIAAGVGLVIKQSGAPITISKRMALFVHLLSFGSNLGAILYTTGVLGIVAFKNLPRQTFGKLQSKLFPIYFSWSSIMLIIQLATGSILNLPKQAVYWLLASLFATLMNSLWLEPASTKIMFSRYALQDQNKTDSEEYKKLGQSFGKYHGMSSLINMIPLVGGFIHAFFLSTLLA